MRPYTDAAGTLKDATNWTSDYINEMGILVEIGENGNWYMGKTWYSKDYDLIGNFGGNKNSVFIINLFTLILSYFLLVFNFAV